MNGELVSIAQTPLSLFRPVHDVRSDVEPATPHRKPYQPPLFHPNFVTPRLFATNMVALISLSFKCW